MPRALHRALALLAAAAIAAATDGSWQPTADVAFFQREMAGFAVLGAWTVGAGLFLLTLAVPRLRAMEDGAGAAAWLGLGVGLAPMLSGFLSGPLLLMPALAVAALGLLAPARQALGRLLPLPVAAALTLGGLGLILAAPILPPSSATLSPATYDPAADPRPLPPAGPDVILVSVDTLRADAILGTPSSEGGNAAPTPYLDGLRERALWADYALSPSNQTLPGHVGMLTGVDAMVHGVRSNVDFPDPELKLLSEVFHDAGYATAGTIANALLSAATGMGRGYDLFSDQPIALATYGLMLTDNLDRSTWVGAFLPTDTTRRLFQRWFFKKALAVKDIPIAERVLDAALPQIRLLASAERPYFAFVHFMDPHTAYRPPADLRGSLSAELEDQVAARFMPPPGREIGLDLVREVEHALLAGEDGAELAARYYHLVYLEEVVMVDRALAKLEAELEATGRDYVLLITSDHGEQFGEYGLMEHANSMYEENLRVPFVLAGPRVVPGKVPTPPLLSDVAPTLLWHAGLPIPEVMTGTQVDLALPARASVQVDQKEIAVRDEAGLKWTGAWSEGGDDPEPRRLVDLGASEDESLDLLAEGTPGPLLTLIQRMLEADTWAVRQAGMTLNAAQAAMLSQLGYADQEDQR